MSRRHLNLEESPSFKEGVLQFEPGEADVEAAKLEKV
jgi:hypothetical protein